MDIMRKRVFYGAIFLSGLMLMAMTCNKHKYFTGHFPETPVNLSEFNTEFDDYNSASPIIGETSPFCFSSTRNSQGENYDIVYKLMSIEFSRINGTLRIYENTDSNLGVYIRNTNINNALNKINTSYDEFGPCLIPQSMISDGSEYYQTYIFLYSNNKDGKWSEPVNFGEKINTSSDEYRPIVKPQWDFINDLMIFSSNRPGGKGGFDLYFVGIGKINRIE